MMGELQCDPANFASKIIFMSMFNDIVWKKKENEKACEENSGKVREYGQRFSRGHWSFGQLKKAKEEEEGQQYTSQHVMKIFS